MLFFVKPLADFSTHSDSPLDSDAPFVLWLEAKRRLIVVFASLAALFWTVLYFQFTVDDSFISFRYGRNLVAGHVWNWNLSGVHEEAYTSALYTALSVIPALLHASPSLFFKCVGLACVGAMVYRLHSASKSRFAFLLGLLLICLHPWVWLHAFAGLETPLYILLLLEMGLAVDQAATTSASWVYLLFLLLPLTRPEGVVFACAGVGLFWYRRGNAPRQYPIAALAFTVGVAYFVWRVRYFHHLLPNPFYLKVAHSSWTAISWNLENNLQQSKGYFLGLLLLVVFARRVYTRILVSCGLLLLLLFYAPHAMQMNYADRFYFQVAFAFLLFFLIAEDVARIARVATVISAILVFSITVPELRGELHYFPFRTRTDIDLARRLAPFAANHTILTPNAGAIPYYSGWTAYDFFGLGTYRIGPDKLTRSLLRELHPDVILVESTQPHLRDFWNSGTYPNKRVEIEFIQYSSEYEYVGESGCQQVYNVEFVRNDTPQHDAIVRALQENMQTSSTACDLPLRDILMQRYVRWRY